MWLATPAIGERPAPERLTDAQVAALKAISETVGADQQKSLTAINELRKGGTQAAGLGQFAVRAQPPAELCLQHHHRRPRRAQCLQSKAQ
jgi:hypothetical protein